MGAARPAAPTDKLDPELAEHSEIGRLYAQSFKAGTRIPQEFRGSWSNEPSLCGTDEPDEGNRIFVKALTFQYSDETHVATKVTRLGPRSIRIAYGPLVDGYHEFVAPPVLTLSKDGKVLEGWETPGQGSMGRWTKCPFKRKSPKK